MFEKWNVTDLLLNIILQPKECISDIIYSLQYAKQNDNVINKSILKLSISAERQGISSFPISTSRASNNLGVSMALA